MCGGCCLRARFGCGGGKSVADIYVSCVQETECAGSKGISADWPSLTAGAQIG